MFYNKKKLKIIESELICYKSEYNHLREIITSLFNKNEEQQQKIDKAIEHCKSNMFVDSQFIYELLEILGDKENE